MSRVLLAGVAVAGVAATTSAFTTSNTVTVDNNIAGYVQTSVSGATVTNIAYTPDADPAKLLRVTFTTSNDITSTSAIMGLKLGTDPATGQENTCSVTAASKTIACTLAVPILFQNFDGLALTVTSN